MIKYHDHKQPRDEVFILCYGFKEIESIMAEWHGSKWEEPEAKAAHEARHWSGG